MGLTYLEQIKRTFATAPVIICGMHRSGTTMVSSLVRDCGVFLGQECDDNRESFAFREVNDWFFELSHAAWDQPGPLQFLYEDNEQIQDCLHKTARILAQDCFLKPYAPKGGMFSLGASKIPALWGWKDPRTTLLIPIWSKLFPKARWIFVERNGVDVARSLQKRELEGHHKELLTQPMAVGDERYLSLRCRNLEDAFTLWEEYIEAQYQGMKLLEPHQRLVLRYEHMLKDPQNAVEALIRFLDVSVDTTLFWKMKDSIKPSNRTAEQGVIKAAETSIWMRELGYSEVAS